MPLGIFDDVLLQDLPLKAPQCALDGFPILNMNLRQRTPPISYFSISSWTGLVGRFEPEPTRPCRAATTRLNSVSPRLLCNYTATL